MKKILSSEMMVLEVTRRCNMECEHCLRGDAQSCDMQDEVMEAALSNMAHIGKLIFSGGEPTLNLHAIQKALEIVQERNIPVYGLYVVTNGKGDNMQEFIDLMDQWFLYVNQCSYDMSIQIQGDELIRQTEYLRDEDARLNFAVSLSADRFHDPIPQKNLVLLASRSYFSMDHMQLSEQRYGVIRRGRGENFGNSISRTISKLLVEDYSEDQAMVDMLYVSARGDLFGDCDLSYDMMDNNRDNGACGVSINVLDKGWGSEVCSLVA